MHKAINVLLLARTDAPTTTAYKPQSALARTDTHNNKSERHPPNRVAVSRTPTTPQCGARTSARTAATRLAARGVCATRCIKLLVINMARAIELCAFHARARVLGNIYIYDRAATPGTGAQAPPAATRRAHARTRHAHICFVNWRCAVRCAGELGLDAWIRTHSFNIWALIISWLCGNRTQMCILIITITLCGGE